jgi:hypothetical protein
MKCLDFGPKNRASATSYKSEIATLLDLTNRYINLAVTWFVGNLFDLTILEVSRFSDVTIYKT